MKQENIPLSENFIIADADYIDYVTFQLSVQFERMLGRRIPKADLSRWVVDVALDGGLRPKKADSKAHETQLILVHDTGKKGLDNFAPSSFDDELNGKAFSDPLLGEFIVNAYDGSDFSSKDDYILDLVRTVCGHDEVRRIMIIPNGEQGNLYDRLRQELRDVDDTKHITLFAMQPMAGGNFSQEILGYSIMNALGIRSDELNHNQQ